MVDDIEVWRYRKGQRTRRSVVLSLAGLGLLSVSGALFLSSGRPDSGIDFPIQNINPTGKVVWHPSYAMPWFNNLQRLSQDIMARGHAVNIMRFPELSRSLVDRSMVSGEDFILTKPASEADLMLVHSSDYIAEVSVLAEHRKDHLNPHLLDFIFASVGGTYETAKQALENGAAVNLAGGYHHAFPDREEGFCFFNDVAVAIEKLREEGLVKKVMIVDLDVHHGNGNASIYQSDRDIVIFDMFQGDIYPSTKYDVEFPIKLRAGTDDSSYLSVLSQLSGALTRVEPDIVFYLAGADPYKEDMLGGLSLTKEGLKKRDAYVLGELSTRNIPAVVVLGGGYSPLEDLVEINRNTVQLVVN